jgi:hypothetical protein
MNKVTKLLSGFLLTGVLATATASVLEKQKEMETNAKMVAETSITIDKAIAIARTQQEAKGAVTKAELESEHNQLIWQIEVITPDNQTYDISVNAKTGHVVEQKLDKPDTNKGDEENDHGHEGNDQEEND